ncbi:hypothetical protein N7465_011432 [Penicillium sp. CMV-2018d]|nr:hypothetical protein N7465_011432 [Penicillium sp. CMV-2018d]
MFEHPLLPTSLLRLPFSEEPYQLVSTDGLQWAFDSPDEAETTYLDNVFVEHSPTTRPSGAAHHQDRKAYVKNLGTPTRF